MTLVGASLAVMGAVTLGLVVASFAARAAIALALVMHHSP